VRRSRPWVVITCHDAPSLVGSPMMFKILDRRGLRRIGSALSTSIGHRFERRIMGTADTVIALTANGAAALEATWQRPVRSIPHIVTAPAQAKVKDRAVFAPGYLSDIESVVKIAEVVRSRLAETGDHWTLWVGSIDDDTRRSIDRSLTHPNDGYLRYLGHQSEAELFATFASAAIVVRIRGSAPAANSLAASGPLSWAIAHGCVCITDDDRAGATELVDAGLVTHTDDLAATLAACISTWSAEDAIALAAEAERTRGGATVAQRYAEALLADLLRESQPVN
jgi:hypothetical protein